MFRLYRVARHPIPPVEVLPPDESVDSGTHPPDGIGGPRQHQGRIRSLRQLETANRRLDIGVPNLNKTLFQREWSGGSRKGRQMQYHRQVQ